MIGDEDDYYFVLCDVLEVLYPIFVTIITIEPCLFPIYNQA